MRVVQVYLFLFFSALWYLGNSIDRDAFFMERAIALATQAIGNTNPNPHVGCVIVDRSGNIIAEGYHKKAGSLHAEAEALLVAGDGAKGATAYVSLEPCNHHGRTPPCTGALLRHGIARVVAAVVDPDPRVSGKGLAYLRSKGVDVRVGVLQDKAKDVNLPFIFRVLTGRPLLVHWINADYTRPSLESILHSRHSIIPEVDTYVLFLDQLTDDDWRFVHAFPDEKSLVLVQSLVSTDNQDRKDKVLIANSRAKEVLKSVSLSEDIKARIKTLLHSKVHVAFLPVRRTTSNRDDSVNNHPSCQSLAELSQQLVRVVGSNAALMMGGSIASQSVASSSSPSISAKALMECCSAGLVQKLVVSELPISGDSSRDSSSLISDHCAAAALRVVEAIAAEYDKSHTFTSLTHSTSAPGEVSSTKVDTSRLLEFDVDKESPDQQSARKRVYSYKLWTYRAMS